MSYYLRVFSPSSEPVPIQTMSTTLVGLGAGLAGDTARSDWDQFEVKNGRGATLFLVERNLVSEGSLAHQEVREFENEIADCLPKAAAEWLLSYLASVKTIYALQVLDEVYADNGWEVLLSLKTAIWNAAGGLFQADGEGFSNEEGYHILWQFADNVDGEWWMAVLQHGTWQKFKMDLGDHSHRLAFQLGQIPEGVERA